MNLLTPVSQLNRVGKTTAKKLERLGVRNAQDLLYYFPFRYDDFRHIVPIANLKEDEPVTVCAVVEIINNRRSFRSRKNITEALVSDKTGSLRIVWFNQPFLVKNIKPGEILYFSGKVKKDMLGPQLVSPGYEKFKKEETTHTARLVPIYPLTYGISEKQLRFLISQVLPLAEKMPDWLPDEILEQEDLIPLPHAIKGIHFPADECDLKQSTDRLKFDELFLLQMKAELARRDKALKYAPALKFLEKEVKDFVASLPFTLTKAQKISAWEILQDIAREIPMNRLVSGDVGSGKTVVAAMALYNTALNGFQGVMMAPTEILARQHYDSLCKLFRGLNISIGLLTANSAESGAAEKKEERQVRADEKKQKVSLSAKAAKQKKAVIAGMKNGQVNIIVGTHALLSEGVDFNKLGLVIVDEQHRFGVQQRKIIKEKGKSAHFLSMTATPIPRSLALIIYGDLDVSVINELPPGRKKILTRLVEPAKRPQAYDFIRQQIKKGRQAFVICPMIEEAGQTAGEGNIAISAYSPAGEKKSVMKEYEKLAKHIFPDLRVAYLHGKLKAAEKEKIMREFKAGNLDILVSTSVVEVGVDIPNASVMMVEGAGLFGLAQLHQFRGRVGRSQHQSYCLLFTDAGAPRALERLKFFENHHDGFKLAEKDLEMRGPGEVYGTEQSGMMNLRLAKLTDYELIKKARLAAQNTIGMIGKFPVLLEKIQKWEESVHLE
jgi:ATP-dependent DNA helicase RecG